MLIVGLLDDDAAKRDARIGGIPVLGPLASDHVALQGITHLIVAMPTATRAQRRRAIDLVLPTRLPVLMVPGANELQELPQTEPGVERHRLLGALVVEPRGDGPEVVGAGPGRANLAHKAVPPPCLCGRSRSPPGALSRRSPR